MKARVSAVKPGKLRLFNKIENPAALSKSIPMASPNEGPAQGFLIRADSLQGFA